MTIPHLLINIYFECENKKYKDMDILKDKIQFNFLIEEGTG